MFTGLIRHLSLIQTVQEETKGLRIWIQSELSHELSVGDSVAVDGVCLTVEEIQQDAFRVYLSPETLTKTHFGYGIQKGQRVHLERPLRVTESLDGHIVLGHVDTIGLVRRILEHPEGAQITVDFREDQWKPLVIPKGSIAVDGVSLTVNTIRETLVDIWLIPHTIERTHFLEKGVGALVNLEFDVIGKYVMRMREIYDAQQGDL